jgi:hypothetical protein
MAPDLDKKASSLEDEFFRKEDLKLIARLRELEKVKETHAELAKVSGIKDEAVLKKLVALNIHPQTLAALTTIPLVEVAWADGAIDDKERKALLDAAKKSGGVDATLLEQWLSKKPEAKLLEAWKVYVQGLAKELGAAEFATLKADVLGRARAVAEASGGLLGLGSKVSAKEAAVLKTLESAFGK